MGDAEIKMAAFMRRLADEMVRFSADLEQSSREPSAGDRLIAPMPRVPSLGIRQRQILGVEGLAGADGLKAAEIAAAIDYQVPNTNTTLGALARLGLVEQVPGSSPRRWRIPGDIVEVAERYRRIADTLGPGEWTWDEWVSQAAQGNVLGADMVGLAAQTFMPFAAPHRIVSTRGYRAERLSELAAEGVEMERGRPAPGCAIAVEELRRRAPAAAAPGEEAEPAELSGWTAPLADAGEEADPERSAQRARTGEELGRALRAWRDDVLEAFGDLQDETFDAELDERGPLTADDLLSRPEFVAALAAPLSRLLALNMVGKVLEEAESQFLAGDYAGAEGLLASWDAPADQEGDG